MRIGQRKLTVPATERVVGKAPNMAELTKMGLIPPQKTMLPATTAIEWTIEKKNTVFNMLKWGIPIEDVAITVGCSVSALYKYCKEEIKHARIHANTKVAEVFYKMAVSGKVPAATMGWMKARVSGFRDTVEHTGAVSIHASTIDPSKLTIEQLKALESIQQSIIVNTTAEHIE